MKIYLASSWKNAFYPNVLTLLRDWGYDVYDFRDPRGNGNFNWKDLDSTYENWNSKDYVKALEHPVVCQAFKSDYHAMQDADVFVGVAPFGRSASMEMGWAAGRGIPSILYFPTEINDMGAELMVKLFTSIAIGKSELCVALDGLSDVTHENFRRSKNEYPTDELALLKRITERLQNGDIMKNALYDIARGIDLYYIQGFAFEVCDSARNDLISTALAAIRKTGLLEDFEMHSKQWKAENKCQG